MLRSRIALMILTGMAMSLAGCSGTSKSSEPAGAAPLIPRDVIFGNPDRINVQVSRDGKHLSYCAPVDNVLNVWVAPIDDLANAKPVTRDTKRGIRMYYWAWTNDAILYLQDEGGDENWNVFRAPIAGGETTNLTPNPKVRAEIYAISDKHPDEILVALNDRDAAYHDLYRVNITSGKRELVLQNPGKIDGANVTGFVADEDYAVRYAMTMLDDGSALMHKPRPGGAWAKAETIPMADVLGTEPLFFDQTGKTLYMKDSRGRDTIGIRAVDPETGEKKILAEDPKTDADDVLRHPATKKVQAVSFVRERQRWQPVDPAIQRDFDVLRRVDKGEMSVDSRSHDDTKWVVTFAPDNGPWKFYLYDRPKRKATFLFTHNSRLEGLPLVKMRPVTFKSRDGLDLVGYLSLPRGSDANDDGVPDDGPLPMVLVVHGGPWSRDRWGYNGTHQWLANRGYAVLSVNFRGSTGFGKTFTNAGDREWGRKMHEDLIDAVNWATDERIAQRDKVAIHGGSYGGYSALAGVTLTPDVFACSVNIVGISNLITFMQTIPEYWKPGIAILTTRVGDPNTEEGRKLLVSRSPLTYVDRITKPLLIGHGANDARVKKSEADQIVAAMKAKGIPVTYVIYPDEGHGFMRPENRMSFYAVDEAFLSRHLGGRCEPIGDDFKGASINVEYGAEHVPGLARSAR